MAYIGNEPIVSATRTVTEITATAGQTTFTANGGYALGNIDVFVNGAQLQTSDFTATNGSTVVLAQAAQAGDDVRLVAWGTFSVPTIADGTVSTAKLVDSSVTTAKVANAAITPSKLSQPLTSGTAVASTSGTSIDFTSIPSWVRRITVMLNAVSTSGTSVPIIQIGDAGGIETTGYLSAAQTAAAGILTGTTGYPLVPSMTAASSLTGNAVLCKIDGNTWIINGDVAQQPTVSANVASLGGAKTLSETLTTVRITTVNGTDTFDAGLINILYE